MFLKCELFYPLIETYFPLQLYTENIRDASDSCYYNNMSPERVTLDFSSLLKNHFECSFVSSECSLQSSNVCFEVRSDSLRSATFASSDWLP